MRRVIRAIFWLSLLVIPKMPFVIFQSVDFLLHSPFFPRDTVLLWICFFVFISYVFIGVYYNLCYLLDREIKFPNWNLYGVAFSISLIFIPSSPLLRVQLGEMRISRYCDFSLKGIIDPDDKQVFANFVALTAKQFGPSASGQYSIFVPPNYRLEIESVPGLRKVMLSRDIAPSRKAYTLKLELPITTTKGVRLGDSEADVRRIYAGPYFAETRPDGSRKLVYSNPQYKEEMSLGFEDDKLVSIEILL